MVVKGRGQTLLGKKTLQSLGLLRVGPVVNEVGNLKQMIQKLYSKLFNIMGTLKDYQLALNIDETVQPRAQPVQRVPFGLRDKVSKKLDELVAMDIIQKVEGPSSWTLLLVVVPKPDCDIRICVDMQQANEAIKRERQPIPTVQELPNEMNGSHVFSKLDLKWNFIRSQ